MSTSSSPLQSLRQRYLDHQSSPIAELESALLHSNTNISHNVYVTQNAAWSRGEAERLDRDNLATQPLWGIPVSLKDCFDLAGFTSSCGSAFYRDHKGIASEDSAVAARLRTAGAIITGKTHLHQLAYGITGQNADFGDCMQPNAPSQLTGGSSSGAAASIQEGSALAAIGTDTGGSIRVPAALCGLSGYRSSLSLNTPELWRGGAHLAPSFDTLGWLYRDLADGALLGHALFDLPFAPAPELAGLTVGIPSASFLHDCAPTILDTLNRWQSKLAQQHVALSRFDAAFWNDAMSIFAPIQASEAATLHRGNFTHFEAPIAERLFWGESITADELTSLRARLDIFRTATNALFEHFDYLLLPCSPIPALFASDDQSEARARILRYTTPISLCGLPVVTLPGGLQLVAPMNGDATLLALSATLANA
ncbi:amidase [Granulicella paludicola]|uniref:amidase n=1 Tax=Granulicella paludicola TaxID=474951 RepID=UPI0021E07337|nr:amidase [Granulicella paludicola]